MVSMNHYSINKSEKGMELLKSIFPKGIANEMNFCLFSTSGVHGSYRTIEDIEDEPEFDGESITFLVIQPRRVSMIYGLVHPKSKDEFDFLKRLRKSSKEVVNNIG